MAESAETKGCCCSVCWGKGFIEGATFKFRNYFPFVFALVVVTGSLLLFGLKENLADKVGTALTTIMSTIVGFYSGGRKEAP